MKRGIPAAASKKSRQWLYTLVLSIADFFRRALHLTPFDTKMVQERNGVFQERTNKNIRIADTKKPMAKNKRTLSLVDNWALRAALFLAVLRNDLDNGLASHCVFERNASRLPLIGIAVILRGNGVQQLFGIFA